MNEDLDIEYMKTEKVSPYERNPRHNDEAVDKVAMSIEQFGFKVPIIVDESNIIIAGHTRLKAAKKLKMDEVPVIKASDLTDEQAKAFRIADNRVTEESTWNSEMLEEELGDLKEFFNSTDLGFDEDEFNISVDELLEDETSYTDKIQTPTYEPTDEKPDIDELFHDDKSKELVERIEKSKAPKKVKDFLKVASYRHIQFDYKNIAEFYAHSDKETQELMEESALVIIDFEKAIQNGFVSLTHELIESEEGEGVDE
ncbi:ParB N-terminal domain-containing protein [Virgibacillus sp. CBA3643]|uniref:ParB N-terminal domain-containing protein n=1 Tax=Virgibacillus sp. CBA3643 TaxID=2942278 RepID=UPI0035A2F2CA